MNEENKKEKTAFIKHVSVDRHGICLEEDSSWWNAEGKSKDFITADIKGKKVTFTVSNEAKRRFNFIRLADTQSRSTEPAQSQASKWKAEKDAKDGYWAKREQRDIEGQKRISRHGAINTAIEIIGLSLKYGGEIDFKDAAKQAEQMKADRLLAASELMADKILEYVNKEARNTPLEAGTQGN